MSFRPPSSSSSRPLPRQAFLALLGCILVASFTPGVAAARTWRVALDGSGTATTVQRGIELATSGDTVLVAPGTYNEDIDFLGKGVVLKSESGPEVTILDGAGQDSSIVMFRRAEPQGTMIDGFTLKDGVGTPLGSGTKGGAVFCSTSSPTIRHCTFTGNRARFGGAIWVGPSLAEGASGLRPSTTIENCDFDGNMADYPGNGGAINVSGYVADISLRENVFTKNSGGSDGGAIEVYVASGSVEIVRSTFGENTAQDQGGAVFIFGAPAVRPSVTLSHNLFVNNSSGNRSGGPGSGGAITFSDAVGSIDHNTIVANQGAPDNPCGGGGLRLLHTADVIVASNIIVNNQQCGLICRDNATAQVGANLMWNNVPDNVLGGPGECPPAWLNLIIVADPQFCTNGPNPYALASTSPAITATGTMGAFPTPGCDGTPVVSTTWGSIKAMYRR